MPKPPSGQGRLRVRAGRHRISLEQVAASFFEMTQRHSDRLDEHRVRLAEQLRLRGGWTAPRPLKRPRRKPGGEPESGGVPAVPDRPKNLSGGAAAAMEFED